VGAIWLAFNIGWLEFQHFQQPHVVGAFSGSKWKKERKELERTHRPAAMVTHPDCFVPPMTDWCLCFPGGSCSMLEAAGKFLLICVLLVPVLTSMYLAMAIASTPRPRLT